MNKRGSVILHILVSGVVVALVAAMLLRMAMLRYQITSRSHKAAQMKRMDESALARLTSNWASGQVCDNFPGYTCAGSVPGSCGCTCPPTNSNEPLILTGASGAAPCQLTIQSPDISPAP